MTLECRTITSPAGDVLTVVDEVTIAAALGYNGRKGGWQHMKPDRLAVLAALFYEGGIADSSGTAIAQLAERTVRYGADAPLDVGTCTNVLRAPIFELIADREVRGRRTFAVRLTSVPDFWLPAIRRSAPAPASLTPEPAGEVELPAVATPPSEPEQAGMPGSATGAGASGGAPAPVGRETAPVEVELSNAVATALLSQVVAIISAGDAGGPQLAQLQLDVAGLEERLGAQVGYVDKLRRQLREAGDEIAALRHERDGLRQRLRSAEHNLSVATSADAQRIIDAEVRRQVDRFMRERPQGTHGADDAPIARTLGTPRIAS